MYAVEYYIASSRNRQLLYEAIQMNLLDIRLDKRSQAQTSTYYTLPFIWSSKTDRTNIW